MESAHPWPDLPEHLRWPVEGMDELLANTKSSAEALRARAQELRDEAATSPVRGHRAVCLTLAGRYEEAAATRTAAR
ncbi:MAG: hypothetical protein WKF94_19585 [Solirubrobacteraceae bacterium]